MPVSDQNHNVKTRQRNPSPTRRACLSCRCPQIHVSPQNLQQQLSDQRVDFNKVRRAGLSSMIGPWSRSGKDPARSHLLFFTREPQTLAFFPTYDYEHVRANRDWTRWRSSNAGNFRSNVPNSIRCRVRSRPWVWSQGVVGLGIRLISATLAASTRICVYATITLILMPTAPPPVICISRITILRTHLQTSYLHKLTLTPSLPLTLNNSGCSRQWTSTEICWRANTR